MKAVFAILFLTIQLYYSLVIGECDICGKSNIACVNATSFKFCLNGEIQSNQIWNCPNNLKCDHDVLERCVEGLPKCSKYCKSCNPETYTACLDHETFSFCFGLEPSNITAKCENGLVCDTSTPSVCVDPKETTSSCPLLSEPPKTTLVPSPTTDSTVTKEVTTSSTLNLTDITSTTGEITSPISTTQPEKTDYTPTTTEETSVSSSSTIEIESTSTTGINNSSTSTVTPSPPLDDANLFCQHIQYVGKYSKPDSCKRYYSCIKKGNQFIGTEHKCPFFFYFDCRLRICSIICNNTCTI